MLGRIGGIQITKFLPHLIKFGTKSEIRILQSSARTNLQANCVKSPGRMTGWQFICCIKMTGVLLRI